MHNNYCRTHGQKTFKGAACWEENIGWRESGDVTDYSETWEPPLADLYGANRVQFHNEITQTVPVYENTKNLTVKIKSTHPSPATLRSLSWEGDYTPKNYKRV